MLFGGRVLTRLYPEASLMLPLAACVGQLSVACSSDCSTGSAGATVGVRGSSPLLVGPKKTIFVGENGIKTRVVESGD